MSDKAANRHPGGFRFLFRTDRGVIGRATWWKGTLPLALIALVASAVWRLVRPYTQNGLDQPPLVALSAYLYLLAFGFGIILLLICEYNLSAKRFFALGLPRNLAAILPLSLLVAGAFDWYVPRSGYPVPHWANWVVVLALAGVIAWNVFELGVRDRRGSGQSLRLDV